MDDNSPDDTAVVRVETYSFLVSCDTVLSTPLTTDTDVNNGGKGESDRLTSAVPSDPRFLRQFNAVPDAAAKVRFPDAGAASFAAAASATADRIVSLILTRKMSS